MSAEEMINNIIHEALSYGYHTAKGELKGGISNGYGKRFRQTFLKEIKELQEAYRNQDDRIQKAIEYCQNMVNGYELKIMDNPDSHWATCRKDTFLLVKDFLKSLNPLP